jgi:hypothetical protein
VSAAANFFAQVLDGAPSRSLDPGGLGLWSRDAHDLQRRLHSDLRCPQRGSDARQFLTMLFAGH